MKIAVTGAGGVVGRAVVLEALAKGFRVVGIDIDLSVSLPSHPGFVHYICNIADFDALVRALDGVDGIIHLATQPAGSAHDVVVHNVNVVGSYNVLQAAAELGIKRICMASSVNAIGLTFSREPRFQYFPIDEQHATFNEDAYGLSKWISEVQAASIARRNQEMAISTLRFHWVVEDRQVVKAAYRRLIRGVRQLWGYTPLSSAVRACFLSLNAEFTGHQVFNIVAPDTAVDVPSSELAKRFYPRVPIRGEFQSNASFFTCDKAVRLLGY